MRIAAATLRAGPHPRRNPSNPRLARNKLLGIPLCTLSKRLPFSRIGTFRVKLIVWGEGGALRYASEETPKVGDRIKNRTGDCGTVTEIFGPDGAHSEPVRITIKWDEGIVEIDYEVATNFTLVSRGSGERKSTAGRC